MKKSMMLLVFGVGASGCAVPYSSPELPSSIEYEFNHRATGEPVRYVAKDETRTVNTSFPVGERVIYSSSGRYVGKEVVYESRPEQRTFHEWHVFQGDIEIDALSALYIARDQAFMEGYEAERARVLQNHEQARKLYESDIVGLQSKKNVGLALVAVGLAGLVGSSLLLSATKDDPEPPVSTMVLGGAGLGFLGLTIGGAVIRGRASTQQTLAHVKINQLTASRMSVQHLRKYEAEEHVHNAVENRWPVKAQTPAAEAAISVPEGWTVRVPKTAQTPAMRSSMPMQTVDVPTELKAFVDASIANNKKLGPALTAVWTPWEYNISQEQAHEDFEEAFVQSMLYWNDDNGKIELHQGSIVFYTDEASLLKLEGRGAKPKAISAYEALSLALASGHEISVHHNGDAVVFTFLELERMGKMREKAIKLAKKKSRR